jgi:hypothetical protein
MGIICYQMLFVTENGAELIHNKKICGYNISEKRAMEIVKIIKPKKYKDITPILINITPNTFVRFIDYL